VAHEDKVFVVSIEAAKIGHPDAIGILIRHVPNLMTPLEEASSSPPYVVFRSELLEFRSFLDRVIAGLDQPTRHQPN
jgi:hypothetical protein